MEGFEEVCHVGKEWRKGTNEMVSTQRVRPDKRRVSTRLMLKASTATIMSSGLSIVGSGRVMTSSLEASPQELWPTAFIVEGW